MELITTFKGSIEDLNKDSSIVLAINEFSVGHDHTFSNKELLEIIIKSKELNTKVYILCNKMIFDEEVPALRKTLEYIKSLDVNGIYFSDMAVFMLARELKIEDLLIFAPGMTVVNSLDVKEYLELGIQAVELANEITLEEKILIAKNNPHKVGIVISGYMLMSYSKRLALSNYFREIDKEIDLKDNFNLELVEATRKGKMPVYQDAQGTYIYSEYILDSFKFIDKLLEVDFKYFRIDGIFLSQAMINDLRQAYKIMIDEKSDNDYSLEIKEKYPEYHFDNIFYTTETSEVK